MKNKDRLKKILDFHGGLPNKILKWKEESCELTVELELMNRNNIVKELADCRNVENQIMIALNITEDELEQEEENKIFREEQRMIGGYYGKHEVKEK